MEDDKTKLARTAQRLVVEKQNGTAWEPLWGAAVDRIEINAGAKPSTATIWFPDERWNADVGLAYGTRIRIRTDWPEASGQATIFSGFVVNYVSDYTGGTEQGGAYERNAVVCMDHRWLMGVTSPVFGQFARGPDDYYHYGEATESPKDTCRYLSGRRTIFNEVVSNKAMPNKDPLDVVELYTVEGVTASQPVFLDSTRGADPWTTGDMIRYVLHNKINRANTYMDYADPSEMPGLNHEDFGRVINHVVVDGLSVLEAIDTICRHIGFSFREVYSADGRARLAFYKIGSATGYTRTAIEDAILHQLHAPAVNESINMAVGEGKKMLWAMSLSEDIARLVNNPWGVGMPDKLEFTAELVPGWLDSDLVPDTAGTGMPNLYMTESEIAAEDDPNSIDFFKYYHTRGSGFKREVGRKWVLNESGQYSGGSYDRGMPFDFSTVQSGGEVFDALGRPTYCLKDAEGKRNFGPFRRQLLPCLTADKDELNSIGIIVEFSFNGGTTWQKISCGIQSLEREAGIWISEPNLAEMVDQANGSISGGTLDGVAINFWTSLCNDKIATPTRHFKDGDWSTRVRVTACVQMDQRLRRQENPSAASGSPFSQVRLFDFSEKYGLAKRTSSSNYATGGLPSLEQDHYEWFGRHLEDVRRANEDASISGEFTLERLWLGDGAAWPEFMPGDCIEGLTGRDYSLAASMAGGSVYPEIIQILYLPDRQQMRLITRDLRFAEVVLG